jgi:phosphoribosylamine-glycine ligase
MCSLERGRVGTRSAKTSWWSTPILHTVRMQFVFPTAFFAGLGFAMRLQEEGHDVVLAPCGINDRRMEDRYALIGKGILPKQPLADVIRDRERYRDAIWVWDENHSVRENELLRAEKFQVLGGGAWSDRMEHDRDACLAFVARYGLQPPPSYGFNDRGEALRFLDQHPNTAYVFKPDRGENFETWLPLSEQDHDANIELRHHLRSLQTASPFVLQERKDGIETNVEVWFVDGEPRFAFMTLECKRKLAGDLGDLTGCAFDFAFTIPIDSRAVQESVGRLFPTYREMRYTGFADANVIFAKDGVWFFEKCERFGYNAHPNLFWNLNRAPLGETFRSLLDGTFVADFAPGFGASCSMYMDHQAPGRVIEYPDHVAEGLYFYDVYREGDLLRTAGYYDNVLIANAFGYTIQTAWDAVLERANAVKFSSRAFRVDGGGTGFPSSPLRRYEAFRAMGYV